MNMRMKIGKLLLAALLCLLLFAALSQYLVSRAADGRMYSRAELVPIHKVGIIPGCAEYVARGKKNLFFSYRIEAAVALYRAGKISYILVSGDNRTQYYNEPQAMMMALRRHGVPSDAIYLDYAGFRTLDTVVRAKEVFGQSSFVMISQPFHNRRALFIAHHHHIDAIAFNAQDVQLQYAFRTHIREQLAVMMAVIDVYILQREPHFLGEKIPVGTAG